MACSDKNSLIREGTGQYDRFKKALSPDFAKVDDRDIQDLLLFVQRYAAHVTYFDAENTSKGTWRPLFKQDLSMVLATLAVINPKQLADYHKSLLKRTQVAIKSGDIDQAKACFKYLFDFGYTLAKTIDEGCAQLVEDPVYQRDIQNILVVKIGKAVRYLLTCREHYSQLLPLSADTDPLAPMTMLNSAITVYDFHYINTTPEVLNLTVPDTDELSKINFIVHHNLFQQQLKAVLAGISMAVRNAEALFIQSLTHHTKHKPHNALLLVFLRLFSHAQNHLNQYGRNHLEHYYREILQLKARKPEPDKAHLIFALHKHVTDHLLRSGTLFKGGKDKDGKELVYRLSQDVVLNQGTVAMVHSLKKANGKLVATENSNKAPRFLFGDSLDSFAQTGLGIASNLLFLKGGERVITVSIQFKKTLFSKVREGIQYITFNTQLTGEKGWLEDRVRAVYHPQKGELTFSITIDGGKEAVQAYDEKIHQKQIKTTLPLLLAYLDQAESGVAYDVLAARFIDSVYVKVDVKGYKELALSNDVGLLDGSKPFKPFGDLPRRNAGFYIGSEELFQKPLTSLTLVTNLPPEFAASYLYRGAWNPLKVVTTNEGYALNMPGYPTHAAGIHRGLRRVYGSSERGGYIRLSLASDQYSLSSFMDRLTQSFNETKLMKIPIQTSASVERFFVEGEAMKIQRKISDKEIAADSKSISIVAEPAAYLDTAHKEMLKAVTSAAQFEGYRLVRNSTPTPKELVVDAFEINYSAVEHITAEHQEEKHAFFHLHPFGYKRLGSKDLIGILPIVANPGELCIGLSHIEAPNTISLFFDVVEGSPNPLRPSEDVHWYYLDEENNWKVFEKSAVIDGTRNLTRAGIVTVSFPADATCSGTVMPPGMLWLKAAVQHHIDAVCKLRVIAAQAVSVVLMQDEPAAIYFKEKLPKGTITKLLINDAAIKGIEQPADSFGGRPMEKAAAFYTRVSERLRHKQRAITMWDYEHLVLEQFPSVYKVKCINNAGFVEHGGVTEFCENYPGNITLVTIPDLRNSTHGNVLRPYTPIGLLVDIADYMKGLSNPFVTLHVRNPQFEEIQLEFDVMFRPHQDEAFYLNQLNDDIERFLCPWAFDTSNAVSFGGKIQKSTLIDFIDERPYVDVVSAFKMHHIIRNEENAIQLTNNDVEEIVASSARSILVSYAEGATRHRIRAVQNCECV